MSYQISHCELVVNFLELWNLGDERDPYHSPEVTDEVSFEGS